MARITPLLSDRTRRIFTIRFCDRKLLTTVARRPAAVRRWISAALNFHRHFHHLIVGLGVQWSPTCSPTPSTLQLCIGRRCVVIQLTRATPFPSILKRFLGSGDVTFVGINVANDCQMLEKLGLWVESAEEIREMARLRMGRGNASMASMAVEILEFDGAELERAKPGKVGRSRWDVSELSHSQVVYAAVDAYVSFQLGLRLRLNRGGE